MNTKIRFLSLKPIQIIHYFYTLFITTVLFSFLLLTQTTNPPIIEFDPSSSSSVTISNDTLEERVNYFKNSGGDGLIYPGHIEINAQNHLYSESIYASPPINFPVTSGSRYKITTKLHVIYQRLSFQTSYDINYYIGVSGIGLKQTIYANQVTYPPGITGPPWAIYMPTAIYSCNMLLWDGTSAEDNRTTTLIEYDLKQNYPNPFNPTTVISFSIPFRSFVSLKVFNIIGREVALLVNEQLSSGNYSREFNAMNLSCGVYYYRLQVGNKIETKKLVLLR